MNNCLGKTIDKVESEETAKKKKKEVSNFEKGGHGNFCNCVHACDHFVQATVSRK